MTFCCNPVFIEIINQHSNIGVLSRCVIYSRMFEMLNNKVKQNSRPESNGGNMSETKKIDKQFLCDVCSRTFASRTGLGFHLRTHTGYKPYTCQYCGKSFTISSNKIRHERTHTGDKHFKCHFCSTSFASSNGLKYHLTIHTGESNYHCETCGKSFTRLKYLKEHNFTHTGEKPFVCKICGACYGNSGSLFAHEKKCKVQFSSSVARTDKCNSKESQYVPNQENNGSFYLEKNVQSEEKSQTIDSQDALHRITYPLPSQSPCTSNTLNQTHYEISATIKPGDIPSSTWQCLKWNNNT